MELLEMANTLNIINYYDNNIYNLVNNIFNIT